MYCEVWYNLYYVDVKMATVPFKGFLNNMWLCTFDLFKEISSHTNNSVLLAQKQVWIHNLISSLEKQQLVIYHNSTDYGQD